MIKRMSVLKILAIVLIVFMSMSVVSTSELADSIADSSDDGVDLKSNDDAAGSALETDDDQSDLAKDEPVVVKDDSKDQTANDDSKDQKASDDSSDKSADDASGDSSDCKLSIDKKGDKKVQVGDTVTWNITVKNSQGTAKKVVVKENLPKNFEFVSAKAKKGTFDKKTNEWKIGDLKESENATLTIKMKAKKAGNFTNKVEVLTDSNNLNKTTTVKADVKVVSKDKKAVAKENKEKKEKIVKKAKKFKDDVKKNLTKANKIQKNKKAKKQDSGNPIMVLIIAVCVVLGLGVLRRQK